MITDIAKKSKNHFTLFKKMQGLLLEANNFRMFITSTHPPL